MISQTPNTFLYLEELKSFVYKTKGVLDGYNFDFFLIFWFFAEILNINHCKKK